MELREKIARLLTPSGILLDESLDKADAILAIPEIRDALHFKQALETPGAIQLVSGPPIYRGEDN